MVKKTQTIFIKNETNEKNTANLNLNIFNNKIQTTII